ncbi:DUF2563 family protein [Mycobacterium sp. SM1]|uniref:DUF2563 family protein n=1 Tax=Mycobacterium sp. SM1 TaxID=2816243 RepID=UPI001BD10965|nr:DUF2563 family protein [Mycobacterium sp. SM1]MBS4728366.1 DUF2563 family protein [Mycobacterium sp. SM1]
MFVDTALLRSGANESHHAGEHAQHGANHLSRAPLFAGMFGDFQVADTFYGVLSAAHAHHVKSLQRHQEILDDVGGKANHAATAFTVMDDHNAKTLREVPWCGFGT